MNDELLALYTAARQERIEQLRMGTSEYRAMRERDLQRRLRAAAILETLASPAAPICTTPRCSFSTATRSRMPGAPMGF